MKKAALVVGTRPQFVKTAPLILELGRFFRTILIHTGQHYDFMMSGNFFSELNIPNPDYHLETGGGAQGRQIGRMIEGLEAVMLYEKPDIVIVVGDTNSTLAGAVTASKLKLPLAHIEAGVRSKDKNLPEQINRLVTDAVSDFFMCPTPSAVENLRHEGKMDNLFDTGDVIYDCLRLFETKIPSEPRSLSKLPKEFILATMHRAEAVDGKENLESIFRSLGTAPVPVIFPAHPRTRKMLASFGLQTMIPANLVLCEPLGYLDMLSLVRLSRFVVTDSGGVQREAVYLGKQAVIARPETEWVELEKSGWVIVAGYDFDLSRNIGEPKGKETNLQHLTRPASARIADIMAGI